MENDVGTIELYGGGYDSSMKLLPDNQGDRCEERELEEEE